MDMLREIPKGERARGERRSSLGVKEANETGVALWCRETLEAWVLVSALLRDEEGMLAGDPEANPLPSTQPCGLADALWSGGRTDLPAVSLFVAASANTSLSCACPCAKRIRLTA